MEYTNGLYTITELIYGINDYARLKHTNRLHKIYYTSSYRLDASPYIKINGLRYHLSDFLQATF